MESKLHRVIPAGPPVGKRTARPGPGAALVPSPRLPALTEPHRGRPYHIVLRTDHPSLLGRIGPGQRCDRVLFLLGPAPYRLIAALIELKERYRRRVRGRRPHRVRSRPLQLGDVDRQPGGDRLEQRRGSRLPVPASGRVLVRGAPALFADLRGISGSRGGRRRVRPATARRACRPPGPGRPRRPRRPSAGRRPEPPDAVGLGAVSRSRAACETPGAFGLAQSSILLVNTHSPWIADWMPALEDRRHAERWK